MLRLAINKSDNDCPVLRILLYLLCIMAVAGTISLFKLSGFDVDLPGRVQPIVTGPIQLNFVARRIVQNGLFPQITLLCGRLLKNDTLFK